MAAIPRSPLSDLSDSEMRALLDLDLLSSDPTDEIRLELEPFWLQP